MEAEFGGEISSTAALVFITFVLILLVCGIPSNTLFLWTFLRIKRLRQIHNAFVGNLAMADFLITTYLLPFNLVFLLNKDIRIPDWLCHLNGTFAHVVFSTSVISVSTIAVHRYVKICHFNLCAQIYTRSSVSVMIASVWIIGILFALPLLCMEHSLIFDPTLQMCIFNRYVNQSYSICYMLVCLFAPVGITMICYFKIFAYVRRHKQKLLSWNNGIGQQRFKNDVRSTKSTFVVFVLYLLLYSLFGILAMFFKKHSQISPELHAISIYLAFANSCVNTFIYGFMNKRVLSAYKEALSCRRSHKVHDVSVLTQQRTSTNFKVFTVKARNVAWTSTNLPTTCH
ncbi:melatonin receptor type 1B-like [Saccostrea echinata]|uniref:melatonin receptor type 1B-like n=1 Tax=Saccostrea echinata TaxID=191078 RepID=UPI002A7F9BF2|nr:melatonin receptor type 1B-like [Saccostrea echinata]